MSNETPHIADFEALHRDLVSRLGFGNNVTEPMADNDTIVRWLEELNRDADEWRESQLWRNDCYVAGHPEDDDCWECDPTLRLLAAEAKVEAVEALVSGWETGADQWGTCHHEWVSLRALRDALSTPDMPSADESEGSA